MRILICSTFAILLQFFALNASAYDQAQLDADDKFAMTWFTNKIEESAAKPGKASAQVANSLKKKRVRQKEVAKRSDDLESLYFDKVSTKAAGLEKAAPGKRKRSR